MEELKTIVQRAQAGEVKAYSLLVQRFQDMAVGYSYSVLGDFGLAEDAAQEAFIDAYRLLAQLREAAAFPGWFRRIVYKQCDRLIRGKQLTTVALDQADHLVAPEPDPAQAFEQREVQTQVWQAINQLPLPEREAVTLFYISQYSQSEIAAFLELPLMTVKSRLHSARRRLKERMLTMIQNNLPAQRPSRDENFSQTIMSLLQASAEGDTATIKALLAENPGLIQARAPVRDRLWTGDVSPLHWAVMHQQVEVIELLLAQGADIQEEIDGMTPLQSAVDLFCLPGYNYDKGMIDFLIERGAKLDIFSAMWLGQNELVKEMVEANSELVHARGPGGTTPLCFAGPDMAEFLIDHGADIMARLKPQGEYYPDTVNLYMAANPIQVHARWPNIAVIRLLLERAKIAVDVFLACVLDETEQVIAAVKADPSLLRAATGESHVLGPGRMLPHLAARYNRVELVNFLLEQGADIQAQAPGYRDMTPLHLAAWQSHLDMVKLLVARGADIQARSGLDHLTPLELAEKPHGDGMVRTEVVKVLKELGAT
jgi:RNA polymerase sigma factor (sigma-70 family)